MSNPGGRRPRAAAPEPAGLRFPTLLVVGLTGGIASGKSTAARLFAELGATVLDADQEARAIVAPGEPALAELVEAFGAEILREDGTLNRARLAERAFARRRSLELLNRITHPRIAERLETRLRRLAQQPPDPPLILVEAAILLEAGWESLVDRILVVDAQPSTQQARLIAGSGLSVDQATRRIRAQLSRAARLRAASAVLDGEAPPEIARRNVARLWEALLRDAPRNPRPTP